MKNKILHCGIYAQARSTANGVSDALAYDQKYLFRRRAEKLGKKEELATKRCNRQARKRRYRMKPSNNIHSPYRQKIAISQDLDQVISG